jgi:anhydro-N-acetylmuramic acid kinase
MNILGIMSGTSLDGLDFAMCSFRETEGLWTYEILYAETVPYDDEWTRKLGNAQHLMGLDLLLLDRDYGRFIAGNTLSVMGSCGRQADLIASHGHTVFHQPEAAFTLQIGSPQLIAAETGVQTVGNFRELDMLHGGQGAPLVPVGDELLFGDYDYCLNLGGFANVSFKRNSTRQARDVCPANIILNSLARELGLPYDLDGKAGRSGDVSPALLERLNGLEYYAADGPGSLSREWFESEFLPLLTEHCLPVTDLLCTLYEHIAVQISRQIHPHSNVLLTGGGAYNTYLVERITHHCSSEIVIPPAELIEFKEALVFAFLGLLRLGNKTNCYASVTGAERDTCCGVLYLP